MIARARWARVLSIRRDETGGAVLELALVTPLLLVFLILMVGLGRLAAFQGHLDEAAREAARAASLTSTPEQASVAAYQETRNSLGARSMRCAGLRVDVDTTALRPGGTVHVQLSCRSTVRQLAHLGAPGTVDMRSQALAPVVDIGGVP